MSEKWYYDTDSGQAVQGKQKGFLNRIGPFDSREAAMNAIRNAEARNEAWDAQDEDD